MYIFITGSAVRVAEAELPRSVSEGPTLRQERSLHSRRWNLGGNGQCIHVE